MPMRATTATTKMMRRRKSSKNTIFEPKKPLIAQIDKTPSIFDLN